jgi:amino acid transporter
MSISDEKPRGKRSGVLHDPAWFQYRKSAVGFVMSSIYLQPVPESIAAPVLKPKLGLRDVTLLGVACIVGSRWIPAAAHAGPGSVTLWLAAALLFAAPLAAASGALAVKYPGSTGGLYVWTREDFGPWHGFLCFWVYWIGIAFLLPTAALFYMGAGFYALGPKYAFLADNRIWLLAAALAAIWIALGTNLRGVDIGKWTENIGAMACWLLGATLVLLAVLVGAKRGSATPIHVLPTWNWDTVNFWSNIAYGLSGVEMAAMMAAEIRDPARTLPRAGWLASGFATVFYMICTVALLVLLRPEKISELNGLAEAGAAAGAALGRAWIPPLIAVLVVMSAVGQFGGTGTTVSRLPFAAGVDNLLPPAFARLHPRWGTPYVSILTFGAVASFLLLIFQLGDSLRAAYQEMVSLMVITGFLPYLYIFGSAWKAGKRLSAISGTAITLLAIFCSLVPTDAIVNIWLFEGKLAAGTLAVVASAWLAYRRAQRTAKRG